MGSATQYVFGTLLTANGSLKYLNIIAGCGFIANITLNLILIPRMQAEGAAIASLTTQLLVPGIQIFVVRKMFDFATLPKMMLTLFVFALGEIVLAFGSTHLPPALDWKIRFLAFIAASGVWVLATGVLNIKSILKTVKIG